MASAFFTLGESELEYEHEEVFYNFNTKNR
jgi:hypothetical protein